jgi:hypothetical protein
MHGITIRTQAEFDALPEAFEEYMRISIANDPSLGRIVVRRVPRKSSVRATGNASVEARDKASIQAYDNASVDARDKASIEAYNNVSIWASGNASVQAYGHVSVQAHDQAAIRRYSGEVNITLHDSSVCLDARRTYSFFS